MLAVVITASLIGIVVFYLFERKHPGMMRFVLIRISQTWETTFLFVSYTIVGNLIAFQVLDYYALIASVISTAGFVWAQWFINDFYDFETDRISNSDRPTINGQIPKNLLIPLFFLISIFSALPLVLLGWNALLVYACMVVINILYSVPPLRLKAYPLPSVICLSAYTVVCGLLGLVSQNGQLSFTAMILGGMFFLGGIVNVSYKDLKDADSDAISGVRNFVLIYGVDKMKYFLAVSHMGSYIMAPILFGIIMILPITFGLGLVAGYFLITYRIEKGSSIVKQLDFINACIVLIIGMTLWQQQIPFTKG